MALGVALPLLSRSPGSVALSGLLVGATFMVVTMAGLQEARRVGGRSARALMAAMTSSFAIGQIAGPLVVSATAARGSGYGIALGSAALLLLATGTILFFSARKANHEGTHAGARASPDG
jgi:predicted MFS family arabinose efflux permease